MSMVRRIRIGITLTPDLFFLASVSFAQGKKPNVVFMMVDNLGWGEIGVYGGRILRGVVA